MNIYKAMNFIGEKVPKYKNFINQHLQKKRYKPGKDGHVDDNGMQGTWEQYYNNGKLATKGNYVNGERDGYWEYYDDNGKLFSKGNYVNGKRDGYWEYYKNNGKLSSKGNYKNGELIS